MSGQTWLLELLPPAEYKGEHPLRELFADIVDNLPDEDRILIEAIFYEGLSLSEAAYRLGFGGASPKGIQEGTAAKQTAHYRMNRALRLIREALDKEGFNVDDPIN